MAEDEGTPVNETEAGAEVDEVIKPLKPTRITPFLIAECAGVLAADSGERMPAEEVAQRVLKLVRLRLDRRNIVDMDGLECCEGATHVYLQHNAIERIDGLQFFAALTFLSLDRNLIRSVENLRHLAALRYLGLAHNLIEVLDVDQLPRDLAFLDAYGNPCSLSHEYRSTLTAALPSLLELDQVEISRSDVELGDEGESRTTEGDSASELASIGEAAPGGPAQLSNGALQQGVGGSAELAASEHISRLRAGSVDVQGSLDGMREKKAAILARAKERRRAMRDLKQIAL